MRAFRGKGRFGDLLGRVPVKVILNPKAGLFGAAAHGLERWEEGDDDRPHP
jgi:glucokinase